MEKMINKLSKEFYFELEQLIFMIDEINATTIGTIMTEERIMRQLGIVYYIYTKDIEGKEKND